MKQALLMVDLQNDFMPGGALPVPDGNSILSLANLLQQHFPLILATQDWHPLKHGSFATQHANCQPGDVIDLYGIPQIVWPPHCIQNTQGAEFVAALDTKRITKIFYKGIDEEIDSYSGFFDNGHRRSTGLADYLRAQSIEELYIIGVATDYCIKFTVLDACSLGFKTYVIADACRGVNLQPNDSAKALTEMQKAGAIIINSSAILLSS